MLGIGVIAFFALEIYTRRKTHRAMQAYGFGSLPGQTTIQYSPDVATVNCTPATGYSPAMYCNPPGVECATGTTCADARANYMLKYNPQAVSSGYDPSCPTCVQNIGIGGTPIVGGGAGDIQNTYGWYSPQYQQASQNPYLTGGFGYGYGGGGYPYGYPQQGYGYGYPQYPYGYPQQGYGYGYPQSYGYPYGYGYGYGYPGAPGAPGFGGGGGGGGGGGLPGLGGAGGSGGPGFR